MSATSTDGTFDWLSFLKPKAIGALIFTAALNIPLLGLLPMLLAYPVLFIFPEFASSGPDVSYTFGMLWLSSAKAWLVYWAYFFSVGVLLGLPGAISSPKNSNAPPA